MTKEEFELILEEAYNSGYEQAELDVMQELTNLDKIQSKIVYNTTLGDKDTKMAAMKAKIAELHKDARAKGAIKAHDDFHANKDKEKDIPLFKEIGRKYNQYEKSQDTVKRYKDRLEELKARKKLKNKIGSPAYV